MRKKYICLLTLIVLAIGLSGCIIPTLPNMTEEQEKSVTEYAAGLLLKYDTKGAKGLMSDEELEAAAKEEAEMKEKEERNKQLAQEYIERTEEARKQKEEEKASNKEDSSKEQEENVVQEKGDAIVSAEAIGDFLGMDGLDISLTGFDTVLSYPGDGSSDLFSIDAAEGKKLVVAHMTLKNTSSENISVDMFDKEYDYQLDLGEGGKFGNSKTLLLNDFSMYKDSIAPDKSVDTVLLFEVDESADIADASLRLNNGNENGSVR